MFVLQQIPTGNGETEESSQDKRAKPNVNQSVHTRWTEDHGPEICYLRSGSSIFGHEVEARRRLHKTVGDDDPNGTEEPTEADHASRKKVELGTHFVPPEDHNAQKTRL